MKSAELIKTIADKTTIPRQTVTSVLSQLAAEVQIELEAGGETTVPGIGKFLTRITPARKGRNPNANTEIDIPEKRKVAFKPAVDLRQAAAL